MRSKSSLWFALLAVLFICMRLLPVFTAVERVSHYDELDLGVIAKEWLEGPRLPLWHYQMDPYGGESIVLGALAVPFVKILGPTLLAVKIPSLLFAILIFGIWFIFLRRYSGLESAVWGSLLLIFAPPSFVQFSLAGLSGHAEALAFSLGALYFFYDFLFASSKRVSIFLFAVLSGLGFWFYHENAVMTAACVLSWIWIDRKSFLSPSFFSFLFGLALGLAPWFAYTHYYGSEGAAFALLNFRHMIGNIFSPGHLVKKTASLFLESIPFSFAFFPVFGIHEKLYSLIYFCVAYIPLLPLAFKQRFKIKLLPLLLFPFVFLAAFILSIFDIAGGIGYIGYRYLAPLQFFMMLLTVLPASGKTTKIFLLVLMALGLLGQTSLMFQEPFGRVQKYKGTSYYRVGTQWVHTLSPFIQNPQDWARELAKRDPVNSYFLLSGITSVDSTPPPWLEKIQPRMPAETISGAEGLAKSYLRVVWDSNTLFCRPVQKAIQNLSPEEQGPFYRGLGWVVRAIHREDPRRGLDWLETFPPERKNEGLEGFLSFDKKR